LYLKGKASVLLLLFFKRLQHLIFNLFNQSPINGQTPGSPQCIFHFEEDGDAIFVEQSSFSGAAVTNQRLVPLQIFQGLSSCILFGQQAI
jgi:hypothetical protein